METTTQQFTRKVTHRTKGEATYTVEAESGMRADMMAIGQFNQEFGLKPYVAGKSMSRYFGAYTVLPA